MIVYPNAKINLGLSVIRKREDGFHDIETLFVPVPELKDILEIVPSEKLQMYQYGISFDGDPMDNLCVKAYKALARDFEIPPVEIYLHKNIPVGAGLGGGSSDAAHTLIALNEMFGLGLSKSVLAEYAAKLGSDCPFFVYNEPMFATGRGEILEKCNNIVTNFHIEVVTPDIFVSTKEAYAGVIPREKLNGSSLLPLAEVLKMPVERWRECLVNDFEKSVFAEHPEIAAAKEAMYERGAVYASMSGSGSSVFGVFRVLVKG